jgi:hypothetical protein
VAHSQSGFFRQVLAEVVTSLPGYHPKTTKLPPEELPEEILFAIQTGANNPQALNSIGHKFVGIIFWIAWFGWGIYVWWFTGALLAEFLIATAIWIGAFLFTIIGVPLVRRKARIISSNE